MSDQTPRPPHRTNWTRARQVEFLKALKATQSVSRAARSVGMSRQSAYKLRRRLAGQAFDQAWEIALDESRLADVRLPQSAWDACPVCGASPARPFSASELRLSPVA